MIKGESWRDGNHRQCPGLTVRPKTGSLSATSPVDYRLYLPDRHGE